jgi:FAD/FMN-containing dehydrogenase
MADLNVKTRTGGEITLKENTIQKFKESLRGGLVQPADGSYDEAREIYNAMHDRRPALIVQASGVADVLATVQFARDHDLLLAVRGGGHSVPGFGACDGGVVLDLKQMKGIRVDPERGTVQAEGGCTWGDLNHATYAFGLATTGGIVSTTGIAGLTLGGGIGYLARRCGLSCDNLLSANVVTADGTFVTCSDDRERDLFWAIRGGGGNFGVVTSFEYRLHPVADIFGGPTFFPIDGEVMHRYCDFIVKAPEELGAIFALTMAPPLPFVREAWHGKPVLAVVACWTGPIADGEAILAPLKDWGQILDAYLGRMPYPAINSLFDELVPPGLQQYWKANFVRQLSREAIAAHLEHAKRVPCVESGTFLFPIDGACHRVPSDGSAFAYRDSTFSTVIAGAWPDPADNERNIRWVREYSEALRPHSEKGGYVNFMSGDDQDRVRINYGGNYERLVEVKTRWDPGNLFRMNKNVAPRARGTSITI